ncbi:MAG TPA: sulfotransferase [Allosphingosinicella sp.]|jgi:tetratricopeptide (TPR) repeat protein
MNGGGGRQEGSSDSDPLLLHRLGVERCERGDFAGAEPYLRRALSLDPAGPARLDLARALLALGRADQAEALCAESADDPEAIRIRAYALQALGRLAESVAAYERLVARVPNDFEGWSNLGGARLAAGSTKDAVAAFERAAAIRPDLGIAWFNLAAAQSEASDFDSAEPSYRAGLARQPHLLPAWLALGAIYEKRNRGKALAALIDEARAAGVPERELAYLRALSLRRQGRLEDALAFAHAAPASTDPAEKARLIGELCDKLGDEAAAFAAFAEMNRLDSSDPSNPRALAAEYRRQLAEVADLTTAEWHAGWTPAEPDRRRPAPVFLVGFPRSGTTLLDTQLMGHPDVVVLEEAPVLERVNGALGGGLGLLANLDKAEVDALRARYFAELDSIDPTAEGKLVVDKYPLAIGLAALIHRIFPDALFVFAERHPCDVVLSCFMTRFQLNRGSANFLDLEDAARLYDLVLGYWQRARAAFPLDVHTLRYETLVADPRGALEPLADFLGLVWDDRLLDHRGTAMRRDFIGSPSYAQVAEPIYRRAVGRWTRYRAQLAPVLPVLLPWAERLGYPRD